ncbi:MAG: ABC transporter ATP-binding protein [Deltaproteobacteria bacterium]|nr:ABC transporter ATP-binding protein [Deltaproteobacteria bacterium]MBW1962915.1 ABC transporter ATP-binding protein [Deltaproteobacteria bacterium]MBW1993870.1 ABC transporter ATP-binding protein [Deltaproteobacteria bacterium]MBW2150130.1 ABC transporter ATP-binding protein [Deltaproteobacteria bacterium]
MKGIVKRFPHVLANNGIDFRIMKGEIHSLLGENGAGKTTLMSILGGFYQPDEGEIYIEGKRVNFRSPRDALAHGIGMIHQHFQLVRNFTVAENISLGMAETFRIDPLSLEKHVSDLSDRYGLAINSRARIYELSVGEQQRVEILRMLFRKIKILIMDEPTAVLAPQEIERLFAIMRKIKEEGRSIVFITHKLEEVLKISDYITVLRRGKVMSTVKPENISKRDGLVGTELARMMVGREVILEVGRKPVKRENVLLRVENLSVRGNRGEFAVNDISFNIRYGEIFSILGVAGNGQRELVEAIVGLRPMEKGRVLLEDKDISRQLDRVAYIPEDRTARGCVPDMSLLENFVLTDRIRFTKGPFIDWKRAKEIAEELVSTYHIAASTLAMKAKQLSGGNLQKLILAREFSRNPLFLIAEQPTRGLDIGATEEIWQALLRQRKGSGVLLVSGDIKEVLSLSDTILVMFRGQIMDAFPCDDERCLERIGPLMAGVKGQA